MRIVIPVFVLMILALPCMADMIIFKDELSLECDVIKVTKDTITVQIAKGTFAFSRNRVKKIEYDFRKKRDMLAKDDFAAHYKLGLWCLECNQIDNALSQFLLCEGKPGVPDDVFLKIGRIYLQKDQKNKTIEYYKKYLAKHPEDDYNMKKLDELSETSTPDKGNAVKQPEVTLKKADEGLEIMPDWKIEKWGNPGTVGLTRGIHNKTENKMLKIDYDAKNSDKVALRIQKKMDLTDKKTCAFDVYNPANRVISIAIAFVTNPGYSWHESKGIILQPGWNLNVKFDLNKGDYKTKATNWKFKSPIKNKANTTQIIILIYNGSRKGTLFFDNIKVE